MMGSPYYYDVLFDDVPGDVVFHDCMWSGICTCCIQLLHQESYFHCPDLPVEMKDDYINNQQQQHQQPQQQQQQSQTQCRSQPALGNSATTFHFPALPMEAKDDVNHQQQQQQQQLQTQCRSQPVSGNSATTTTVSSSNRNSPDNSNSSLSSATSSSASSTSTSPKPLRRREHNDSERKRRDHLRNAFNFLRDQVPRFKQMNKKPPRIQILHEATKYVQCIMKESLELEQRLEEERAKHSRLKQQQFM